MPVIKRRDTVYLTIGEHVYCYDETIAPLGEGAMGIVYRGFDQSSGRPVAIKRIRDRFCSNAGIRARARLEASLMFSHPNLVEMLGCSETDSSSGPIFIVSGFIDGETIDTFIDRNIRSLPSAESRICNMFLPVLDALGYIHQKQIVHLDVKPSNIMVERGRNVRLMDLGIADVSMKKSEIIKGMMGTPKYAAPEQFASETHPTLTAATDVYEAGVTLYELLSGHNPFAMAKTIDESRMMHETLVLPSTPAISTPVLEVLRKATAIKPEHRYIYASEMKAALQRAILTPKPPKPGGKWKYWLAAFLLIVITSAALLFLML